MDHEPSAISTMFVLPLATADASLEAVGGKGASLARLSAAGLPVPPGFHVTTTAYRYFVTTNNLQDTLLNIVATIDVNDPTMLDSASTQIAELFARGITPPEVSKAIRQAYAQLGGEKLAVAVRSSATAEDLPEMSFAGQQETYLNIHGEAMLLDAVKRCWASLWTARAIGYRARNNIAPATVSLAVVVQALVPADASGILFTANPLTGARDQVMVNAAWGLGEAIVGGLVTPDTVVVDKATGKLIMQQIGTKDVMTVCTATGTQEAPVPAEMRSKAVLTRAQAAELTYIGLRIEELYGQPMDIEWALQEGRFFVVQARPITALPARSTQASPVVWTTPNAKGHYARSSVIELLPDPLSPLFATLGVAAWNRAMNAFARKWGVSSLISPEMLMTINGYAYYDVTYPPLQNVQMLLVLPRLVPLMRGILRTAQQRWEQEGRPRYVAVIKRWQEVDVQAEVAVQLVNGVREITSAAASYYLTIQSGILPAAYLSETVFTFYYNRSIKQHDDPPALTLLLGYDSVPIQAEKSLYDLAQWLRTQSRLGDILRSMSGAQFADAYSSAKFAGVKPQIWSEFCQHFTTHLEHFGHTIYDLDFAKAVPADDPAALLETLKFFLNEDAPSPYQRQAASAAAREEAMQMLLDRLHGWQRSLFQSLLQRAQRFVKLREDALADVGLGWPLLRRMLREVGRRIMVARAIKEVDDVFWLTADELAEAVLAFDNNWSVENYQGRVAERHALWTSRQHSTPPVVLPVKGGARFLGIDYSKWLPAKTEQETDDVLKGIGASPGRISATARVIRGPAEFYQMQPGDILVARITTPAWTPLFALAAGVVTDVGGPLSHSSIVAREYHIPAVLGTGVATAWLYSGQRITVDGDKGLVEIGN